MATKPGQVPISDATFTAHFAAVFDDATAISSAEHVGRGPAD